MALLTLFADGCHEVGSVGLEQVLRGNQNGRRSRTGRTRCILDRLGWPCGRGHTRIVLPTFRRRKTAIPVSARCEGSRLIQRLILTCARTVHIRTADNTLATARSQTSFSSKRPFPANACACAASTPCVELTGHDLPLGTVTEGARAHASRSHHGHHHISFVLGGSS